MAKVIFGNHSAVIVPRTEKDRIRRFYCDILGCKLTRERGDGDDIRMGDNFHMRFLYGDHADESEFLRSGKSIWLEIKSDDVEGMKSKIIDFGVRKLEIPDPHLYFQAPGGQALRLVGINEDLSKYEGTGEGPHLGKVKEAIGRMEKNRAENSYLRRQVLSVPDVHLSRMRKTSRTPWMAMAE